MKERYIFSSLTRISDLSDHSFNVEAIPREKWQTGDYIVGRTRHTQACLHAVELINGRMAEAADGDLIVGAFGQRAATLEAVGDWQIIDDRFRFDLMTPAGLFGKVTSKSTFIPELMSLVYRGHVHRYGRKLQMIDFVPKVSQRPFNVPIILIIGTSMSAGKTLSARIIVNQLNHMGLKVIGTKLTGAARYRDVLSLGDAGANIIFDFVDMGLPSTVCPETEYRQALRKLLSRMASENADVVVAEAGASPLEPYNGSTAMQEIDPNICCTVLCAPDPYAVVGVCQAFKRQPDIVAGGAANTSAGVALVKKLTGLPALNLQKKQDLPRLKQILKDRLEIQARKNIETKKATSI